MESTYKQYLDQILSSCLHFASKKASADSVVESIKTFMEHCERNPVPDGSEEQVMIEGCIDMFRQLSKSPVMERKDPDWEVVKSKKAKKAQKNASGVQSIVQMAPPCSQMPGQPVAVKEKPLLKLPETPPRERKQQSCTPGHVHPIVEMAPECPPMPETIYDTDPVKPGATVQPAQAQKKKQRGKRRRCDPIVEPAPECTEMPGKKEEPKPKLEKPYVETPPSSPVPVRVSRSIRPIVYLVPNPVETATRMYAPAPRKTRGPNKPRRYCVVEAHDVNLEDPKCEYYQMVVKKFPMYRGKVADTWPLIRKFINTHPRQYVTCHYFDFIPLNPKIQPGVPSQEAIDAAALLGEQLDECKRLVNKYSERSNNVPDTEVIPDQPKQITKRITNRIKSLPDELKQLVVDIVTLAHETVGAVSINNMSNWSKFLAINLTTATETELSPEEIQSEMNGHCTNDHSIVNVILQMFATEIGY